MTELWTGRLTGTRVPVPVEALKDVFSGLPAGMSVEPTGSKVRFAGTPEAVAQTVHAGAGANERVTSASKRSSRGKGTSE